MPTLQSLLTPTIGVSRTERLLRILEIPSALLEEDAAAASRALIAQALNMLLFDDLIARVPAARPFMPPSCCLASGDTIHPRPRSRTHGPDMEGMGALPRRRPSPSPGFSSPLGYALHGTYPLDRLKMTGRSYAQADLPEDIAQFFLSELHVDRFPEKFPGKTLPPSVTSVTGKDSTRPPDPRGRRAPYRTRLPQASLPGLERRVTPARCSPSSPASTRQHPAPAHLPTTKRSSPNLAEMAWIATEGNAFNHATDRVQDVEALADCEQKALGQPMKPTVETSQSGRVRQTAFLAARVKRWFRTAQGDTLEKEVAGSFYEFITRLPLPEEKDGKRALDLSFDSSNAQAIFKMTAESK